MRLDGYYDDADVPKPRALSIYHSPQIDLVFISDNDRSIPDLVIFS